MKPECKNVLKKIAGFFGLIGSIILFIFGFKIGRNQRFDIVNKPANDNNPDPNDIADRTRGRNNELAESIERSNIRRPEIDRIIEQARKTNIEATNLIDRINNGN